MAYYPSSNDREYDLLKKIAINTGDASVPGTSGAATAALQTAGNATLTSLLAKTPALGVAGTPSADVITTQGVGYRGTATITRAANTTPYSINDVVGGVLTITGAGPVSGDVLITSIRILSGSVNGPTALPSGLQTFTLHVYSATPPSAIADNSAFSLPSGDYSAYIAHIDNIPVSAVGTGTQAVQAQLDNIIQQFRCDSSGRLFAYLVTNQAFTPAAQSETYSLVTRGILP